MKRIFLPLILVALTLITTANKGTLEKLNIVNSEWQKNPDGKILASTVTIGNPSTYNDWIATHLMLVENTLRLRDVSTLSIAQQQHRKQLLDELHGYWQAGVFPINSYTNYKTPVLIDAQGTHCAVGYLMQRSGNDVLAQTINSKEKFAYVHEIKTAGVGEWADEHGLTVDELAWIQPGYPPVVEADNLEGGVNGTVNTIVADAGNQIVYIGGSFTQSGKGNPMKNVAAYISGFAGFDWIDLAGGVNGNVNALLLHNNKLYVAGSFTTAGTTAVSNVAVYDVTTNLWSALGAGLNGEVNALAVYNNEVHAGGSFTDAVSKWNGSAWQVLPNTLITGTVRALEVFDGKLVIGGDFDITTGALRRNAIAHDGTNAVIMGFGTVTPVNDFAVHEGKLFAACDVVQGADSCALAVYENGDWVVRLKGADGIMDAFGGTSIKHIESNGSALLAAGEFWCGSGMTYGNNLMSYTQQTYDTTVYNVCTPLISVDSAVHTFTTMSGQLYFGGAFNQLMGPSSMSFNQVASIALQATGIEGVNKTNIGIQAYPNPSADLVMIKANDNATLQQIEIFDVEGKKVLSETVTGISTSLKITQLPSGIYNVHVHTAKGRGTVRLIKN